ncbi:MAG: aminotransferase class V-fold PLP-dependent enzyme, partial [Candidatus Omnitrophica bacterium]|nr:aminotransferase class V-fold PLP-dependent enzyme [Candidatus Omnitrophota bacterium]
MARPIIHHRTPEFQKIIQEVEEDLKYVYQTKNEVLIFTASGTGAMEGSVVNLLSPGDKVLVVRGGKFGERFGEICQAYGIEFIAIDVEWGKAVDPKKIEDILKKDKNIKVVYTTLCETSTGVATDIEAVGKILKNY